MLTLSAVLLLAAAAPAATPTCPEATCVRYELEVRGLASLDDPLSLDLPAGLVGSVTVTLFDNDAKLMAIRLDVPSDDEEVDLPDGVDLSTQEYTLDAGKYWTWWFTQEGKLYKIDVRWVFDNQGGSRRVLLYVYAKNKTKK